MEHSPIFARKKSLGRGVKAVVTLIGVVVVLSVAFSVATRSETTLRATKEDARKAADLSSLEDFMSGIFGFPFPGGYDQGVHASGLPGRSGSPRLVPLGVYKLNGTCNGPRHIQRASIPAPVRSQSHKVVNRPPKVAADVIDRDDSIVISCDVPGVKKEDVKISVKENLLTVSGSRKKPSPSDEGSPRLLFDETVSGNFSRTFRIPDTVDLSGINATQTDGVLTIVMMKKPEKKPINIPIS